MVALTHRFRIGPEKMYFGPRYGVLQWKAHVEVEWVSFFVRFRLGFLRRGLPNGSAIGGSDGPQHPHERAGLSGLGVSDTPYGSILQRRVRPG